MTFIRFHRDQIRLIHLARFVLFKGTLFIYLMSFRDWHLILDTEKGLFRSYFELEINGRIYILKEFKHRHELHICRQISLWRMSKVKMYV